MRYRNLSLWSLYLLTLGSGLAASTSEAGICSNTSWKMYAACRLDANEEFEITQANCNQVFGSSERWACRTAAWATRAEDKRVCVSQFFARIDACNLLSETRYADPLADPSIDFIDPDEIPEIYPVNPYVSLEAGHTHVLRAGDEGEELVVVHVTEDTREILGVLCRVVVDVVLELDLDEEDGEVEYEAVEVTDDWFAQDADDNVYYCGEVARNFEDGVLTDLDGSFEAGKEFAKGGVLIRRFPMPGDAHRQEFSLEEAEDIVRYVDLAGVPTDEMGGENEDFPCVPDGCLQTLDFAPLEPDSTEFKFYIPGLGFVLAVAMEDGEPTGEREELVCTGDSLEILSDPDCGIEDPDALVEQLCKLAPDTFCGDD